MNENTREIYIDNDNDKYFANMPLMNQHKQAWSRLHPKYRILQAPPFVVLIIGLAVIFYVNHSIPAGGSSLPLHVSIWLTALLAYLAARYGKSTYERPFEGFHNGRFEATDKGLYYIYQRGMKLITVYIKDKDLRQITRDDDAHVLLIEGAMEQQIQSRKGTEHKPLDHFYALVPFDEYDLDDLLAPYGEKVRDGRGTLRGRYLAEGSEQ